MNNDEKLLEIINFEISKINEIISSFSQMFLDLFKLYMIILLIVFIFIGAFFTYLIINTKKREKVLQKLIEAEKRLNDLEEKASRQAGDQ